MPLSFDVAGMFWLLYAIDRELVLPKSFDAFFPWWLNQFVHTNIVAFVVFEMLLLHHNYPCRRSGLGGLTTFLLGYLAWVNIIKFKADVWVYPVLDVLNWPQRIGFYIFTLSIPILLYYVGEFLNNQVWSKSRLGEDAPKNKSKKSKAK